MHRTTDSRRQRGLLALALASILALLPAVSLAATNTGSGDVAGTALTPGSFDLTSSQMALAKTAFLASTGAQLTSGDKLPKGTQVKFLVYFNNDTAIQASDVTIQDVLDPTFQYVASSMKASALDDTGGAWCPGGTCDESAIFTEVDTNGTALGDGDAVQLPTDADVGSYTAGTTTLDWGNGNNANNTQLDVTASFVWAVVFTVTLN